MDWILIGLALAAGAYYLARWGYRGFWVPRYVHGLALSFLALGMLLAWVAWQSQALTWHLAILFLLGGPLIVYSWFAFQGGVEAAADRDNNASPTDEG